MSKKKTGLAMTPAFDPKQLDQAVQWCVSGASEQNIVEAIQTTFPGVDAPGLIKAAMVLIAKNIDADPAVVMAWTFEAAKHLYQRMVEANDFAGALKALKFMNDAAGQMAAMAGESED